MLPSLVFHGSSCMQTNVRHWCCNNVCNKKESCHALQACFPRATYWLITQEYVRRKGVSLQIIISSRGLGCHTPTIFYQNICMECIHSAEGTSPWDWAGGRLVDTLLFHYQLPPPPLCMVSGSVGLSLSVVVLYPFFTTCMFNGRDKSRFYWTRCAQWQRPVNY